MYKLKDLIGTKTAIRYNSLEEMIVLRKLINIKLNPLKNYMFDANNCFGVDNEQGGFADEKYYKKDGFKIVDFSELDLHPTPEELKNGKYQAIKTREGKMNFFNTRPSLFKRLTDNLLNSCGHPVYDIMEVYDFVPVWTRPEEQPAKKMTVSEIAKALGHDVEIVKESKKV